MVINPLYSFMDINCNILIVLFPEWFIKISSSKTIYKIGLLQN